MLWARVRDGVLARAHQLGRQVALRVVDAMRRALADGRRLHVVGSWPQVFAALGFDPERLPCGKAARAALALLAELAPGSVVRVTSHAWRVVSDAVDRATETQLDLAWGGPAGPDGKAEFSPERPSLAAQRPAKPVRVPSRARALDLERLWGPQPAAATARAAAARVDELGAVEAGEAFTVTLTAKPGADAAAVAEAFAVELARAGGGCWLVPERRADGTHLHFHGLAVGTAEQVRAAVEASGAGSSTVDSIRPGRWGLRRMRFFAGYATKGDNEGETIASGVLAEGCGDDADGVDESGDRDGGEGAAGAGGAQDAPDPRRAGGAAHGERGQSCGGPGRHAVGAAGGRVRRGLRRAAGLAWGWLRRRLGG
jgi:hypothetical protein